MSRRIEGGARHLVEHRLEEVVVVAVDDRDPHGGRGERAGSIHAAEAGADDDDVGVLFRHEGKISGGRVRSELRER